MTSNSDLEEEWRNFTYRIVHREEADSEAADYADNSSIRDGFSSSTDVGSSIRDDSSLMSVVYILCTWEQATATDTVSSYASYRALLFRSVRARRPWLQGVHQRERQRKPAMLEDLQGPPTSTYRNQGRWDDAEKLDMQVMETSKTKLGVDHPDTLTSMANLASAW